MKKVVFDTNFLIDLARFNIDIDEIMGLVGPCEFYTIDPVLTELNKIASKTTRVSRNAKIALKLIGLKGFKILKSKEKNTDDAILKLAEEGFIVATNDIELKKGLRKQKTKIIYLRSRKHLEIG